MKENSKPSSSEKDKKRNLFSIFFFVALAALTIYTVFKENDMQAVLTAIHSMNNSSLVLAVFLAVFYVSAEGLMTCYLLRVLGNEAGPLQCIKYSFIGFFFSGITPSATGGQPMQLYSMNRDDLPVSGSTVVLMTVATAYKFVLVLMGLIILAFGFEPLNTYLGGYVWLFYFGLFTNTFLVIVLLMFMFLPGPSRAIVFFCERWCIKLHILKPSDDRHKKLDEVLKQYHDNVIFLSAHKPQIAAVTVFTFIQRMSLVVLTYVVYRGLHLSGTSAAVIMMIQAAVYISVDMLPLPGAQGITELMYKSVFATVFTEGTLAASMCVSRGITFYFLLIFSLGITLVSFYSKKNRIRKIQRARED